MSEKHFKFIKIEVARTETTDLYIKVPEDFNIQDVHKKEFRKELAFIADDTTDDMDWSLEDEIHIMGIRHVGEKEASEFCVGEFECLRENI